MEYTVEIVKMDTRKVVHSIECNSRQKAEKVEDGVSINLNHDEYFTRIKEVN